MKLLVIHCPALSFDLATRGDLTLHLPDLMADGGGASVAPVDGAVDPFLAATPFWKSEKVVIIGRRVPRRSHAVVLSAESDSSAVLCATSVLADESPDMTVVYLSDLDPASPEVEEAVRQLDERVGELREAARALGVETVVLSDSNPGIFFSSIPLDELGLGETVQATDVPTLLLKILAR